MRSLAGVLVHLLAALSVANLSRAADDVRFGRDVLPILSESCFACHGPDEAHREADLRLDIRDSALESQRKTLTR